MTEFDIKLLSAEDGTWDAFVADWTAQCGVVGEAFDDYAPDVIKLLSGIVDGSEPSMGGTNRTEVGALWDAVSNHYYAVCDLAPVSPDGFKRLQKPVRDARAANAF